MLRWLLRIRTTSWLEYWRYWIPCWRVSPNCWVSRNYSRRSWITCWRRVGMRNVNANHLILGLLHSSVYWLYWGINTIWIHFNRRSHHCMGHLNGVQDIRAIGTSRVNSMRSQPLVLWVYRIWGVFATWIHCCNNCTWYPVSNSQ